LAAERLEASVTGAAYGPLISYSLPSSPVHPQARPWTAPTVWKRPCGTIWRPPRAQPRRRFTLAREKNTTRALARRRSRDLQRAQFAAEQDPEESAEEVATPTADTTERKPLFRIPDVRADIRALPSIVRSRRLVLLPLALLAIGFILIFVFESIPADLQTFAGSYLQFFYFPPALFTFFLAGFFAPRASYLFGFIYGVIAGVAWFISLVPPEAVPDATAFGGALLTTLAYGVVYGTLAAALAAWYRDFLRGMQERGRQRRAVKEVDERARRREQRQEARKLAKQRPTT
jgi:hypothetical protein